jgi:hypothetical protein
MKHYVYELIDPRNQQPFYVGAGSGATTNKRLQDHIGEAKSGKTANPEKCDVINSILFEGLTPTLTVHPCVDQTHTATTEKQMIKQYGMRKDGGILTNRHPGGGGIKGAGKAGNKNGRLPPKAVYQFATDGTLIKCWPAVTQAAKAMGVSHTAILNACSGKHNTKTVAGYQWSYSDQPKEAVTKDVRTTKNVYEQYDMEWNFIASYPSGVAMKRATGVDPSTLYKYFKGQIYHAGGFHWKCPNKDLGE